MFDHFGIMAPFYETIIKPKPPDGLFNLLDIQENDIVLDVGGGTGRITQFISQINVRVFVLDESMKMLNQATRKGGLLPICGASEHLPFPDNAIDRMIMVDALHHVKDQSATMKELWRVLKPGGRLIIEEPDIRRLGVKLLALGEKLMLMRSHFLSADDISHAFSQHHQATVYEMLDEFNVWIVVEKAG